MLSFFLLLALSGSGSQAGLSADAEFRTLWWSKEQMRNFNPNKPPPKTTEVTIDRWEYTDPVGVPHPDEITAHIRVRNRGPEPSTPFKLSVQVRWKEGPASSPKKAKWGTPRPLKADSVASIPPGGEFTYQAPIAIAPRMDALDAKDWWPHELELIVTGSANGRSLFEYKRPFPIRRGD